MQPRVSQRLPEPMDRRSYLINANIICPICRATINIQTPIQQFIYEDDSTYINREPEHPTKPEENLNFVNLRPVSSKFTKKNFMSLLDINSKLNNGILFAE